ncbi:MAG: 1-deoxy-D-xylulose-5-phosphate reductoisomerase [Clostridiales Family XIII bacterium]|jgi:1-deoxy-D-xylulose-5-phosphate reductoisomerase|nr:1-deoxy-D-xylulose-5-phosphate reductoisomerase [Clostridiales Family XIII bacterium]
MKRIALLGSTGSIGTQALEVIASNPRRLTAAILTCNSRVDVLRRQIDRFRPEAVAVGRAADAAELGREYPHIKIYCGPEGIREAIGAVDCDIVLNAIVGIAGLEPTLEAVKKGGLTVALANKESLVTGGRIVMDAAERSSVPIIPVDSEHSAIFQCLAGNDENSIRRLILTASGGPFRGFSRERLESVGLNDALIHPNWKMGRKITIDSATMMNKAFEIIEAKWLYGTDAGSIEVVIHPQSIIHSLVEFGDGAIMAQLGHPDMKVPISYAFSGPKRWTTDARSLDLIALRSLYFEEPSREARRSLDLAYRVLHESEATGRDSGAIVLNGANEELVRLFLEGKIQFVDILDTLEYLIDNHEPTFVSTVEEVLKTDREAREAAIKRLAN